jgi:outer membrane biosynthesis protein TonB
MELFTFIARSIFVLFLFLSVYQLWLRSDAHYVANRFYLLGGLLACLVLPFTELHYRVFLEVAESVPEFIPVAQVEVTAIELPTKVSTDYGWQKLLLTGYGLITIFFIIRLLLLFIRMLNLIKYSEHLVIDGALICINNEVEEPFAFGNRIFLKNKDYLKPENAEILIHERVHLFQRHWIDVFVSELVIVVQWFNPFAWYYARVVKSNLEFLADQGVLNKGFQLNNYIQHIICETMGAEASVLANHFRFSQGKLGDGISWILPFLKSTMDGFSQNKRRLKMMKNNKKSKWRLLKLLLVLPIVGSLLWAFSEPVYEYRSGTELAYESLFQGEKEVYVIKGKVVEDKNSPLPGTSIVLKGKTIGTVANMKGEFELEVTNGDVIVFSFVGFETVQVKPEKGKELLVKLKKTSYDLDPSNYRDKYKGKQTPPPPPPKKVKANDVPPPPPPPAKDDKPVFYIVEDMPKYNGGMDVYYANLYTRIAFYKQKEKDLSGTVEVQFKVGAKGDVSEVKALDAPNRKAEKIAVLVVSELTDWMPGKQRGKAIATTMVVPVEFD